MVKMAMEMVATRDARRAESLARAREDMSDSPWDLLVELVSCLSDENELPIVCFGCNHLMLKRDAHEYFYGYYCPQCDLPPYWEQKLSRDGGRYFYVLREPETGRAYVQWSHPQVGNPHYDKDAKRESV